MLYQPRYLIENHIPAITAVVPDTGSVSEKTAKSAGIVNTGDLMRYEIRYHSIQSDHILAIPEFSHREIVDAASPEKLRKYIEGQKDEYGNRYKKAKFKDKKMFGFDYVSSAGAVKVKKYKPPKVKKI